MEMTEEQIDQLKQENERLRDNNDDYFRVLGFALLKLGGVLVITDDELHNPPLFTIAVDVDTLNMRRTIKLVHPRPSPTA